jgi:cytochrome c556
VKTILSFALAAAAVTLSVPAAAQFAKPEDAIKYRKAVMTIQGTHVGRLGAMANGRVPFDPKVALESAEVIVFTSKLPWVAFVEGSDKGETRAKVEIWKEPAKFKADADQLQSEALKMAAAAKTGSLDSLKAAFGPLAGSCKGCHDAFQKP